MDAARPEEVDVPYDPLDVVEHVLNAENLPFDRTDDGDLAFALAGDWKDYELWFAWRPEGDCLQLCCALDLRVMKTRRAAAYELVAMINQRTCWVILRSGRTRARSSSVIRWRCRTANARPWPRPRP